MTALQATKLFHAPSGSFVEAEIVRLTDSEMDKVARVWWNDKNLKEVFDTQPIDRRWKWTDVSIEYEEEHLASEYIAILTGGQVQGAMMISIEPIKSVLAPGKQALFVERLFTAPHNRRGLRRDGGDFLKGVGSELLTWAAFSSRDKGYEGRFLLDASPDFVWWYEQKTYLQRLEGNPKLYESVTYTPMELPETGAQKLLQSWEDV